MIQHLHMEKYTIMIDDEEMIFSKSDLIQNQQILMKDNDHARIDDIFQVDENEMLWLLHGVK